ncbi:MAG: ABC transporter ATP-binding protein [Actinomycetota bacterium]
MNALLTAADTGGPGAGRRPPACECTDLGVDLESSDGPRQVLEGITTQLHEGELVSVMGRSGTGKTTLLRVLAGLLQPTPGSVVRMRGAPVDGPPEGAVFVFQNYAASLLPWRTVERNVALGIEGRVAKAELRRRVGEALATVGLEDRAQDYPWRLSGGMQQRVQLARALAMRSVVLLMDEPFGALDAMTKASLQDQLLAVHHQARPTIVFVTHEIDEAVYLSDRVVVLGGPPGRVVDDIAVDLPRPRHQLTTREHPEFLRLRRLVYDRIVGRDG